MIEITNAELVEELLNRMKELEHEAASLRLVVRKQEAMLADQQAALAQALQQDQGTD
jgi:hypothetical protein